MCQIKWYLCCESKKLVIVVWRWSWESPWQQDQLGEGVDGVEELDMVFVGPHEVTDVLKFEFLYSIKRKRKRKRPVYNRCRQKINAKIRLKCKNYRWNLLSEQLILRCEYFKLNLIFNLNTKSKNLNSRQITMRAHYCLFWCWTFH